MIKNFFIIAPFFLNFLFAYEEPTPQDYLDHLPQYSEKELAKKSIEFERELIIAQEELKESDCNDEDRKINLDERF